jgi:O-phospho-L-seryl-tRNASec:L-selenocysteinyl-tRNA synthase
MRALSINRPGRKNVLWFRIDQKSCFKSILAAGFIPVIAPSRLVGDAVCTATTEDIERIVKEAGGVDTFVCALTTTSCFAPRVPDGIIRVATLCRVWDLPHVVNNAYGTYSSKCMGALTEACHKGRVDVVVQSTDKNYLVPVGGAIVMGPDKELVQQIGRCYAGRASSAPLVDLFVTLLGLGREGYKALLQERKAVFSYLMEQMKAVATRFGTWVLVTPKNDISIGVALTPFIKSGKSISFIGAMLYARHVSGTRHVLCVYT